MRPPHYVLNLLTKNVWLQFPFFSGILLWLWLQVLWCWNLRDEGEEGVRGILSWTVRHIKIIGSGNALQQVYLNGYKYKYNLSSIQTNWPSFQTTYHNKCNPVYTKKCNAVPRQECKTTYYNNCLALSCNRWQLFNRYHNKCQKNQVCKTSYSKKCTKVELHFQFFIIWYLDLNFDKLFMFLELRIVI